jgi:hypothetical protein
MLFAKSYSTDEVEVVMPSEYVPDVLLGVMGEGGLTAITAAVDLTYATRQHAAAMRNARLCVNVRWTRFDASSRGIG